MTPEEFSVLDKVDTYRTKNNYYIEVRRRNDGTYWAGRITKRKVVNIMQVRRDKDGSFTTVSVVEPEYEVMKVSV